MSIRYTLRLVENGAEVWRRHSGDREEMLRTIAKALPDLDIDPNRAVNFALAAHDIDPGGLLPGQTHSAVVTTSDLTATVRFEVYRTKTPKG